jgi:serine/threonine protein phosphatase PrpC
MAHWQRCTPPQLTPLSVLTLTATRRATTAVAQVDSEDEFMILASDGIWDVVDDQGAVNFVQRRLLTHRDVQRAAKELADKVCVRVCSHVAVV